MALTIKCDPVLEPGGTCAAATRTKVGDAFRWEPGGDADAYVAFVGLNYLVNVGGEVYQRRGDGTLIPHTVIKSPHIAFRPVAGDPTFITLHDFTTGYARIDAGTPVAPDPADAAALAAANVRIAQLTTTIATLEEQLDRYETDLNDLPYTATIATGHAVATASVPTPGSLEWLTASDPNKNAEPEVPTSPTGIGQAGDGPLPSPADPDGPPRRGPGRPKGSKNRPKADEL